MDPAIPLSPTSSNDGQLPQGFGELVQHNSNTTSFPREQSMMEAASMQSASHPASRMSSPAPSAGMSPQPGYHGPPIYGQQGAYNSQYFSPAYAHDGAYPTLPEDPVS